MKFKFIEHTADIGIEAYGKNIEETFENAALGLFEIMSNTKKIKDRKKFKIKIKSEDLKSLLYDFLERFLVIHDSKNIVFSRIKVNKIENNRLEATAYGDVFNPKKHEDRTAIKAITYQRMSVAPKKIFLIVDI